MKNTARKAASDKLSETDIETLGRIADRFCCGLMTTYRIEDPRKSYTCVAFVTPRWLDLTNLTQEIMEGIGRIPLWYTEQETHLELTDTAEEGETVIRYLPAFRTSD